ncbi:ketol-acid reductoisomerase [Klebsiella aerogenes]|nr:ketol-acid reductoisomerase [Klebsiella aerogenes]
MANYFNTLNLRQQLAQLGKCRFMARDEFAMAQATFRVKKWSSSAAARRA